MENNLFTFRTISDFLNHIVIPEIDNRISNGLLNNTNFPIIINQFQILWDMQNIRTIVELNEEVRIQIKFKPRRPSIKTGEALTVDDMYPDECYIVNPKKNNKPCSFYICKSLFLGFTTYFNFLPNDPNYNEEQFKNLNIKYNILDFDSSIKFKKVVEPYEKYKMLSNKNWPPAPNFYPKIILEYHNNPEIINNGQIVDKILQVYCYDFWKKYLDFWQVCNFFPNRLQYLEKSINCFFNKDYISSIYVLVPQFEGIIKDYLISNNIITTSNWRLGFEICVKKLEELIYSRRILMFRDCNRLCVNS
jgi:hypothetical protein